MAGNSWDWYFNHKELLVGWQLYSFRLHLPTAKGHEIEIQNKIQFKASLETKICFTTEYSILNQITQLKCLHYFAMLSYM